MLAKNLCINATDISQIMGVSPFGDSSSVLSEDSLIDYFYLFSKDKWTKYPRFK